MGRFSINIWLRFGIFVRNRNSEHDIIVKLFLLYLLVLVYFAPNSFFNAFVPQDGLRSDADSKWEIKLDFILFYIPEGGIESWSVESLLRFLNGIPNLGFMKKRSITECGCHSNEPHIGVRRWGSVSLHVGEPRRSLVIRDSKSVTQLCTHSSRFQVSSSELVFLSFVVDVPVGGHDWFFGMFEEGVVENSVIDVEFSLFGIHPFPQLLFDHAGSVFFYEGVSEF